jgi:hypothetical protein
MSDQHITSGPTVVQGIRHFMSYSLSIYLTKFNHPPAIMNTSEPQYGPINGQPHELEFRAAAGAPDLL